MGFLTPASLAYEPPFFTLPIPNATTMPPKLNPSPDFVANQSILADRLGVSRRTVGAWRRKGAPEAMPDGRWNVPEWEEWRDENQLTAEGDGGGEMDLLRTTKLEEQVRKLRISNGRVESALIPRQDVEIMLMSVWVGLNTFIQTLPGRLMLATRGVSDDLQKQEIYQRQADQMIRIINAYTEHLADHGPEQVAESSESLKQLFDYLEGRVANAPDPTPER